MACLWVILDYTLKPRKCCNFVYKNILGVSAKRLKYKSQSLLPLMKYIRLGVNSQLRDTERYFQKKKGRERERKARAKREIYLVDVREWNESILSIISRFHIVACSQFPSWSLQLIVSRTRAVVLPEMCHK